jgi:hypothetical protein
MTERKWSPGENRIKQSESGLFSSRKKDRAYLVLALPAQTSILSFPSRYLAVCRDGDPDATATDADAVHPLDTLDARTLFMPFQIPDDASRHEIDETQAAFNPTGKSKCAGGVGCYG